MVRSSSFRLDQLDSTLPLLYHQHALARAVASVARTSLPTQLVFPDESLAIGLPPSRLAEVLDTTQTEGQEETVEDREEQIRTSTVLVYASRSPDGKVQGRVGRSAMFMMVIFCLQALMISWFASRQPPMPKVTVWLYTGMLLSHLLIPIGILYKLPVVLTVHQTVCAVIVATGMAWCLSSIGDFVLLLSLLVMRGLSGDANFYLMSHAFAVHPS
eukprot:GHVS01000424.1.p1 GENE.GHVS01000424.1~~GHVS01000424.1.p1  ORF type:complete len:215 (+),score=27.63 GHVS01000424.1:143-787(+)